jgi:hypothetical protein
MVRLTLPVTLSCAEGGLKVQLDPWGSPEQENCIDALGTEPYVAKVTGITMLFPANTK